MRKFIIIAIIIFVSAAEGFSAQNENLDTVVDKIQSKYEQIKDFHADFNQEANVKALDKVQKAEGEVWFKKPGMMRWNYHEPTRDEIVSDGQTLWFYDEEEKQVILSPLSQVSDTGTATTLLSGLGKINELFKASFSESKEFEKDGNYLIDLQPKEDEEDFNKVTVLVNKDTLIVSTMYLYDPYGNLTTITLNNIEINGGVSDSLFDFEVPDGVEVIKPPTSALEQ